MKRFWDDYIQTFKHIFNHQAILTTMILSVLLYSFFYPTAYQAQQAEALPIIIVDQENSVLTHSIISEIRKSPNVQIKAISANFLEAQSLLQQQKADGIVLLPDNLTQSLRHGETGGIGIYLSSAYFLKTKQMGLGVALSIEQTLTNYAEKFGQISHFQPELSIHAIPLFNPLSGYGSYIFPAVAPLIIHQTLLLGLCMLIARYREQVWRPDATEFWAIFATALTIGSLGCYYFFGFTFWLYDYPRGGNFWAMLLAVPIFISCVAAMAMLLASFLDVSERAGHVLVVSSIPLFLMSGTAWPHLAMPLWMQGLAWCLPSTHGIQMFIQLNQMGASLYDVLPKLIFLATTAGVMLILAYLRLVVWAAKADQPDTTLASSLPPSAPQS